MDFNLICPNDGRVELGLEDISTVIFRGSESVEIVFVCPQCGSTLHAELRVPNLLVAAMELARHAEEFEDGVAGEFQAELRDAHEGREDADLELRARRERAGEAYCEYFRRQLASVECVEDLLAELEQEG
ncbi:MAG: hypothetical protein EG823_07800 [Actinobacteria bacterium]|nr:hypothetical protein [Actinomycetota bacterium]